MVSMKQMFSTLTSVTFLKAADSLSPTTSELTIKSRGEPPVELHQASARQFLSSSLEKFLSCKSKIGHLVSSVFIMKHLQETTRCSFEAALLR